MGWQEQVRAKLVARVEAGGRGELSRIAAEAGISQGRLHEFAAGGGLSAENFQKLAVFLGFSLRFQSRKIFSKIG